MPEMDGFEAMERLKSSSAYSDIPVIFLTALSDSVSEARGINLGAVDFIMKPFSEPVLLNRIKNHLGIDAMIRERTRQLSERTEELIKLKNSLVFVMADMAENRDKNTGGHIDRTAAYMQILADAMLEQRIYPAEMRGWDIESVVSSARLHDVGKIVISDNILNKPGRLTDEEFAVMKTHAIEGERIIDNAISRTGSEGFLHNAKMIAAYHHEKWDGSGYPYGLKETEIPLQGRMMAVIDVYDALVSERPYKKAFAHEDALDIITKDSGRHFDPMITEIFCKISKAVTAERLKF
jgi:putative two-component system response regulator